MADKQTLILLPGMMNTEVLWRHQIETLTDIADVQYGDLTRNDNIDDLAKSVLASAPETFALAGLSLGGYTAQRIMRMGPERVSRLALLDTSARPDTPEQGEGRRAQIEMTRAGNFADNVEAGLELWVHADRFEEPTFIEEVRRMATSIGPDAYLRQQNALAGRPDNRENLGAIDCPTLVLCGRQDKPTPLAFHEELAAAIPGAALVVIEDCGHIAPLERPRAVSAALRYWLQV
jgi:pimeloyl-ACP methyl ester carboxylesterase